MSHLDNLLKAKTQDSKGLDPKLGSLPSRIEPDNDTQITFHSYMRPGESPERVKHAAVYVVTQWSAFFRFMKVFCHHHAANEICKPDCYEMKYERE